MASTWWPARFMVRAACRPVRTLTSCSGDGPPKITAGCVTRTLLSWEVVGQIVLVQDDVPRLGPVGHPRHSLLSGGHAHHAGLPGAGPVHQGPGVGPPDDDHVRRHPGGIPGEAGVLLGLAGPELDHARCHDDTP